MHIRSLSACAIFAVAALSPNLASAAPIPSNGDHSLRTVSGGDVLRRAHVPLNPTEDEHLLRRDLHDHTRDTDVTPAIARRNQLMKARGKLIYPRLPWEWKRATDARTAGGNAYTGASGDSSGGSVANSASDGEGDHRLMKRFGDLETLGGNAHSGNANDVNGGTVTNIAETDGMPTILNMDSNNAGTGGESSSCGATAGRSNEKGVGGNAYAGSAGKAVGGSVTNNGGVVNMHSNNAGNAGDSEAGCAIGGDA